MRTTCLVLHSRLLVHIFSTMRDAPARASTGIHRLAKVLRHPALMSRLLARSIQESGISLCWVGFWGSEIFARL